MPRTKKAADAVEKETKAAEKETKTAKTAKTAKAAAKVEEVKTEAKAVVEKAVADVEKAVTNVEKAVAEKKPAKKAPKKIAPKKPVEPKVNFFVEFGGVQVSVDEVVANVKATYGKTAKEIAVYLKPEESKAYFVCDGESGSMDVFFC